MEISINDERSTVEVWLSNKEKNDSAVRQRLKPLYAEYAGERNIPSLCLCPAVRTYTL